MDVELLVGVVILFLKEKINLYKKLCSFLLFLALFDKIEKNAFVFHSFLHILCKNIVKFIISNIILLEERLVMAAVHSYPP